MKTSYYNKISKGYNELYGKEQLKKLEIIKKNLKVKKGDLLLDIGCGTGISSQFDCKVIGIDPSIELLEQNNKFCINGFAENLPFKDNVFDFVVSITSIHNFNDIKKSLEEIKRVGKGTFIFSVMKKSKKFKEIKKLIEEKFKLYKILDEEKDIIFFCGKIKVL